jgi:tetratricopeptide (TPR) repeat protein
MRLTRVLTGLFPFLLLLVLTTSSWAQKSSSGSGGKPPTTMPSFNPNLAPNAHPEDEWTVYDIPRTVTGEPIGDKHAVEGPPSCFRWPISGLISGTVSKSSFQVPDKAYTEFQDGCSAVSSGKLPKAQEHLQKAIRAYPQYQVAWVLLGQVQRDQQNSKDATESCQHALELDAKYLPPYLCLADLAARANKWDQVASLTDKVIALHPVKAPGAYYYNLMANLNLHHLDAAEKSGLQAAEEGRVEQKIQAHWLLAKIYEEKGDRAAEAVQLREYLKLGPHAENAPTATRILQQIEAQKAAATSSPDKN